MTLTAFGEMEKRDEKEFISISVNLLVFVFAQV